MTLYDGTADPLDHVNQLKQKMMVVTATGSLKEACICKGFGSTLSGAVLKWFVSLPNKSISTFADLVNAFNQQFASSHKPEKQTSDLYKVVQRFEESTREYLNRFNIEKVSIPKCEVPTAVEAFRHGLHHDLDLYREFTKYPCTTFEEVQQKAVAVMRLEEDESMRDVYDTERTNRKITTEKKTERSKPYSKNTVNKVSRDTDWMESASLPPKLSENVFTTRIAGILKALKELGQARCFDHLLPNGAKSGKVNTAEQVLPSPPPLYSKVVNVITGGSEICGLTYSATKRHATKTKGHKPESSCRVSRNDLSAVTFDETDIQDEGEQHHDALIITLSIGNCLVRKILVGTESPVNLITLGTLKNMGFSEKDLLRKAVPLVGFSGDIKHSLGEIVTPTFTGVINKQVRYMVIGGPSTYNVILGRPWIHEMKAVPSMYHQSLKFLTPWGVQEIRGDQEEPKDFYKDALKPTASPPT
ncbi:uncharacterized protein LOC141649429 [Silene latifolia]|uniref:uncharacterized protein LOC141649429 n=1 Tax=Silene latifolia TaxID=37657 RepID=UPI003D77A586